MENAPVVKKNLVGFGNRGLKLESLDDLWRFSQYVAASGFAPKGMDKPEAVLVAIQLGAELGISPAMSVQNITVIRGKPSVYGDCALALCRASGLFDEEVFKETITGKGDEQTAICRVRRLPNGIIVEKPFSVSQAKRAGLWGSEGPWRTFPERMLQMRARGFALRDAYTDVLKGIHLAEEIQVRDETMTEYIPPRTQIDDFIDKAKTQNEPEQPESLPWNEEEQGNGNDAVRPIKTKCSQAHQNKLFALRNILIGGRQNKWNGILRSYEVRKPSELTPEQADELIAKMESAIEVKRQSATQAKPLQVESDKTEPAPSPSPEEKKENGTENHDKATITLEQVNEIDRLTKVLNISQPMFRSQLDYFKVSRLEDMSEVIAIRYIHSLHKRLEESQNE